MRERPYVLLSVAASIDGYIDDTSEGRLVLSNAADLDRVDAERAGVDAILVGANTIRRDNPRLQVRAPHRRAERLRRGYRADPIKVTITRGGSLDPGRAFFTAGNSPKIVYAARPSAPAARARLGRVAEVVDGGDPLSLAGVLADLAERGVRRLMVEGGGMMHTWFLSSGLADELQLVIAPFFVGEPAAPRLVRDGAFPHGRAHPMTLLESRRIGDVVLLRYALEPGSGQAAGLAADALQTGRISLAELAVGADA